MNKLPINLVCETCKFFHIIHSHSYYCYFCIPCDRYGICQTCCVKCQRSIMYNNKSRYYKTYCEITSFIKGYLYHHETLALICCLMSGFLVASTIIIMSILLTILAEILLGVN
jgi:hypothetical protein